MIVAVQSSQSKYWNRLESGEHVVNQKDLSDASFERVLRVIQKSLDFVQ